MIEPLPMRPSLSAFALAVALSGAACGANTPLRVGATSAALTIPWGPDEVVDFSGDSLVEGGIGGPGGASVPWHTPLVADAASGVGDGKPSATFAHGYSGTAMSTWASRYTDVLGHGGTIAFVAWGVNDATQGVAPAETAADLKTGVLAVWAREPAKKLVIFGPMNNGEEWPEGANEWDAKIAATSAAMQAATDELAAWGPITWVDPRAWWFGAVEAANPKDKDDVFQLTVDNLHLNERGAQGAADYIWSLRVPD
jgi:lysophospholipase L1-like esterase